MSKELVKPVNEQSIWSITSIVEQLRACNFVCEAGDLEFNAAFIALESLQSSDVDTALMANEAAIKRTVELSNKVLELEDAVDKAIFEIRIWASCYGDEDSKNVAKKVVEELRQTLNKGAEPK